MVDLASREFRIAWAVWALVLGVSLFFIHTIQYVHSFSEYLNAFMMADFPASWCPTFLTLYGLTTLAMLFSSARVKDVFTTLSIFSGLVLIAIGTIVLITFTMEEPFALEFMYIYAQTIHVSELLTGLFTVYHMFKSKK